jgi:hypothetical protein
MVGAIGAFFVMAATVTNLPANCTSDRIANISLRQTKMPAYGPEIRTVSGHDFFVLGQDFIDPRKWKKGRKLYVCAEPDEPEFAVRNYRIANLDRGSEDLPVQERK